MWDIRCLPIMVATLLWLAPGTIFAQSSEQTVAGSPRGLNYAARLLPRPDRTDLQVVVTFSGAWDWPVELQAPENCYGSRIDISPGFSVDSADSTVAAHRPDDGSAWELSASQGPTPTLVYTITFDPERMRSAFSPSSGPTHFHAAGCQWMARIGDQTEPLAYSVEVTDLPPGWTAYSTWAYRGESAGALGSWERFAASAIGGGSDAGHQALEIGDSPVDVFVADGFAVPTNQITADVARLIRMQREAMQVFDFDYFVASINTSPGSVAGTATNNLLVTFFDPDAGRTEIAKTVSHEIFHEFLPRRATITSTDDRYYTNWRWVHEGFTEFAARLFLLEAGIIGQDDLVMMINHDLIDLADNAYNLMPVDELRAINDQDGLSQNRMKVAYYQGALIAARWHHQLAQNRLGLTDLIRTMVHVAADTGGELSPNAFFEIASRIELDAAADFERYLVQGEPIVPPADYFEGYELVPIERPAFDLGFEAYDSARSGIISGVDPDGPAYAVGLRDGMVYRGSSNTNRHANAWNRNSPVEVSVEADGQEHTYRFAPEGALHTVMQYRPIHRSPDTP